MMNSIQKWERDLRMSDRKNKSVDLGAAAGGDASSSDVLHHASQDRIR